MFLQVETMGLEPGQSRDFRCFEYFTSWEWWEGPWELGSGRDLCSPVDSSEGWVSLILKNDHWYHSEAKSDNKWSNWKKPPTRTDAIGRFLVSFRSSAVARKIGWRWGWVIHDPHLCGSCCFVLMTLFCEIPDCSQVIVTLNLSILSPFQFLLVDFMLTSSQMRWDLKLFWRQ